MRAISLNLPEDLLDASTRHAEDLGLNRAEYIRRAIEEMNRRTAAQARARRLAESSRRVRAESLAVLKEFEAVEDDLDV